MLKRHSRQSLHLLLDSERQQGGGVTGGSNSGVVRCSCQQHLETSAAVPGGGRAGFYISDSDSEDDEEGIFSDRSGKADKDAARRRVSFDAPVHFERVDYYEEPEILMIIQSVGESDQSSEAPGSACEYFTRGA